MPVPGGHWYILMTISQLEVINRSGVIMGLQMQEVNVIKDASCCRLQRKHSFHSFLNVFVKLSFFLSTMFSYLCICLSYCLTDFKDSEQ